MPLVLLRFTGWGEVLYVRWSATDRAPQETPPAGWQLPRPPCVHLAGGDTAATTAQSPGKAQPAEGEANISPLY